MWSKWSLPARWFHFFAGLSGTSRYFTPAGAADPAARLTSPRRPAPVPGTEAYWLALVSSYLPESAQSTLEEGLRLAVRTRAYWGQTGKPWPDEQPNELPAWVRFGVHGEEVIPKTNLDIQQVLLKELKRTVHTMEAPDLSRIERQRRLLLHGARVWQLYKELARRCWQRAPLEEMSRALDALLA